MSKIIAVQTALPHYVVHQQEAKEMIYQLFQPTYPKIERLLSVFDNGGIDTRYLAKPLEWYQEKHSFEEKNELFLEAAVELGEEAIKGCVDKAQVRYEDIDAIITVCTTGLAAPSLEARWINRLPFSKKVTRLPIWGLGCAGGASGLARAHDYCLAHPKANVLVVAVELCSLTFQVEDLSKSNLIGTSLFADGAACVLVTGKESSLFKNGSRSLPVIQKTETVLMEDSEEVMGWDIKDNGFYVIFSKDIPAIVHQWLEPQVTEFLASQQTKIEEIGHIVAHPGGKKVLEAYEQSLRLAPDQLNVSRSVLSQYGNMSSATVLFVLEQYVQRDIHTNNLGLMLALGPGFSSEMLLMRWE
ncbi:3-oxoacyl-[acyl-carrier-protein] synthase III C-terminal domain-containing protein [Bacillus sp. REN10]|uniref:type III polyketide synthase n=1 Tax=Bacillus sp. REN10 TaxID=2782541 RepID=UPI00193BD4D9|nr:3-oxoacyl-[acyl-carrier-protein] synthase III C-terminal domain-containing protein [Bacillus sp. REN10]